MTIFAPINLLTLFGAAALGLCLVLLQMFRGSVRASRPRASEREQARAAVEATRSSLRELMTMLSVEGASPRAPIECPGDRADFRPFGDEATRPTMLLGQVETELLQRIQRYQLGRPSEDWMNEGEAPTKFHSTPAIS